MSVSDPETVGAPKRPQEILDFYILTVSIVYLRFLA
jgi:hypothetical protein